MKIRYGFVSNSSSSSFICSVCGEETGGYDLNINDTYMFECKNGHYICKYHVDGFVENECIYYTHSPDICPACKLEYLDAKDGYHFMLGIASISHSDVLKQIKSMFGDITTFYNWQKLQYYKQIWRGKVENT